MSRILSNMHAAAKRLHDKGRMQDVTMWEFDNLCLPPKRKFSSADIQRIRAATHVS